MSDPRESKLPKWAQELLHQERLKTALRFPDAPRPPADFVINESGYAVGTPSLNEFDLDKVFSINVISGLSTHFIKRGYLFRNASCSGFGHRGFGEYWITRQDALLALRWDVASEAAAKLLRILEDARETE